MVLYSMILFAAAALFLGLAIAIYRGNTNLIHDYHQVHVKEAERKKYGQAFSKGLFALAISMLCSGIIALFGETLPIALIPTGVLLAGFVIASIMIAKVQKAFNGGFWGK